MVVYFWYLLFNIVNGATYYVRTDGGTRASTLVPTGQCNGLADVAWNGDTTKSNQVHLYISTYFSSFHSSFDSPPCHSPPFPVLLSRSPL